jgi:hypothetical protein
VQIDHSVGFCLTSHWSKPNLDPSSCQPDSSRASVPLQFESGQSIKTGGVNSNWRKNRLDAVSQKWQLRETGEVW